MAAAIPCRWKPSWQRVGPLAAVAGRVWYDVMLPRLRDDVRIVGTRAQDGAALILRSSVRLGRGVGGGELESKREKSGFHDDPFGAGEDGCSV